MNATTGPLAGLKVIELGGIGPVPHAAMVLGDLGADVVGIRRPAGFTITDPQRDHLYRNRTTHTLNLKTSEGRAHVHDLAEYADVILEGFRPGVAERLQLGPETLRENNPRLIYARMTGWGQQGPMASAPGHDINYIALNGTLHAMGPSGGAPNPPLNLAGDFGGGSMLVLTGVLAALWERSISGQGQVIDAAMIDGSAILMQSIWAWRGVGEWSDTRGHNLLDGGAPFYRSYTCADGRYVAVGAIEPQFYSELLAGLGLSDTTLPPQNDRDAWPALSKQFAAIFATQTRDHWEQVFGKLDACVSPVLSFDEAATHAHAVDRHSFVELDGVVQPAPAPRFSRTPTSEPVPPGPPEPVAATLTRWSH